MQALKIEVADLHIHCAYNAARKLQSRQSPFLAAWSTAAAAAMQARCSPRPIVAAAGRPSRLSPPALVIHISRSVLAATWEPPAPNTRAARAGEQQKRAEGFKAMQSHTTGACNCCTPRQQSQSCLYMGHPARWPVPRRAPLASRRPAGTPAGSGERLAGLTAAGLPN
jgi:hypothetical protein